MPRMQQHGSFSLHRFGQVVVLRLYEAWNLETAEAQRQRLLEVCPDGSDGPWAMVTDVRMWGLAGMEMMKPIQEQARRLTELGRTHTAFLMPENEMIRDLARQAIIEVAINLSAKFFSSDADAARWLEDEGFDVTAYGAHCNRQSRRIGLKL